MDNITHALTGLFLSRAGLNRVTPLASPLLMIAANLPDLDIITGLAGAVPYLHWHRHFTHSLLMAPVFAIALAAIFRVFRPSLSFVLAAGVALIGVLSHLLLDLTNIYGIRILLPFRDTWFHWDLTPVIDLWIWTAFAIAVAGPLLARLVGSEIGESRTRSGGTGFAIAALLFLFSYNTGRAVLHNQVIQTLNSHQYENSLPSRVAAFPLSINPLKWHAVAETEDSYFVYDFQIAKPFDPARAENIRKLILPAELQAASQSEPFRVLANFAQYPVYRVIPRPEPHGGSQIDLSDLRFTFVSTALLDRQNRVEKASFSFGGGAPR